MLLFDQKIFELKSVSQRFYFLSDKKYAVVGFANIYIWIIFCTWI